MGYSNKHRSVLLEEIDLEEDYEPFQQNSCKYKIEQAENDNRNIAYKKAQRDINDMIFYLEYYAKRPKKFEKLFLQHIRQGLVRIPIKRREINLFGKIVTFYDYIKCWKWMNIYRIHDFPLLIERIRANLTIIKRNLGIKELTLNILNGYVYLEWGI